MNIATSKDNSQELFGTALKVSNLGVWEWNIQDNTLYWSDELRKIYGLKASDSVSYEKYKNMLHPDDAKSMQSTINNALKTGNKYTTEHRIIWPDGSVHWVQACGKAFTKNNKPQRMLGTTRNIDSIKMITKSRDDLQGRNSILEFEHDELMELNRSKDEFISLASHQLRTPATGVKQYISMLLEGYAGDVSPEQYSMLQTAYISNERQLSIIDDLLRVAHIDSGKVVLKKDKINLIELIHDVINEQHSKFKKRNQKVTFNHNTSTLHIWADTDRLRMAIENIIDNASKYTPEDKPITISTSQSGNQTSIKVTDKGVGIAKEDLDKLFQKFSRISNPLSMKVSGTGLGLYWAQRIIKLHGGDIIVSSRINTGSTFEIILPKK